MDVRAEGGRVQVRITAGPQACADCLVPKPIMHSVLQKALAVPGEAITLTYPGDAAGTGT